MEAINQIRVRLKRFINNKVNPSLFQPLKIVEEKGRYYLIFSDKRRPKNWLIAMSLDGVDFSVMETRPAWANFDRKQLSETTVPDLKVKGKPVIYRGERRIFLAPDDKKALIASPFPTAAGGAFNFPHGIVLLYFEKQVENGNAYYRAFMAEFDKRHPNTLVWKMDEPVWDSRNQWPNRLLTPLGAIKVKETIMMYWSVDNETIYSVSLAGFTYDPRRIKIRPLKLKKHANNPLLSPREENHWEAFTTLNPAAAYVGGKVHILYRAQGFDYISTVGYAASIDGVSIDRRLDYPIYGPTAVFEINKTGTVNPALMSAGGYGGCEDPRITILDGRLYMIYVAFDGWTNLRLAMTSIDLDDFLHERWNWAKPVLVSPPGVIDKSGCLLPEKVNNQYVFFHRIFPDILIDYVDDLNFDDKNWLKGQYRIRVRPKKWDSRKIGVGAPPLKTKAGWLLIYYGVDDRDTNKYHIGVMLLDLKNPAHVLHRTDEPILSPVEEYEMTGFKPGVVYPCGAVIVKNNLLVYYGAADSTVCVAQADLNQFIRDLTADKSPKLQPVQVREIDYG